MCAGPGAVPALTRRATKIEEEPSTFDQSFECGVRSRAEPFARPRFSGAYDHDGQARTHTGTARDAACSEGSLHQIRSTHSVPIAWLRSLGLVNQSIDCWRACSSLRACAANAQYFTEHRAPERNEMHARRAQVSLFFFLFFLLLLGFQRSQSIEPSVIDEARGLRRLF